MGEALAETAGFQKVPQRLAFRVRRPEQRRRLAVEAHDLAQQREVRRPHEIPALREEAVGAAAAVLEPAPLARHREGHIRVARGHAELAEEPHEVRIRAVVVDQEAGIERNGAARAIDHDGVGVAAETLLLFEEVHTVPTTEQRGGRQTRNARTNHSDVLHVPQEYQYPARSSSGCP